MPRKPLEEVLDVLKDINPIVPIHDLTHVVLNKWIVKKNRKHKEQSNSDLNFTNKRIKRAGDVIIKNSTNYNPIINLDASLSNL
jgi:hypothetical protein